MDKLSGKVTFLPGMQLVIRKYRPSDSVSVRKLFSDGTLEHIGPCFCKAMSCPQHISIILVLGTLGYLLGSVLAAVLLPAGWAGLVYYCCYEVYASYIRVKLHTDMQDIIGRYLSRQDDCFWVAEAEVDGRSRVIGMVAVEGKQNSMERYGELSRMIISSSFRRTGLGTRMAQTALEFCKERGFSKVVLETSCIQTAGVALYEKLGFTHILSHSKAMCPLWMMKLARVVILLMEKRIQA